MQQTKQLKSKVEAYESLYSDYVDAGELTQMADEEEDLSMLGEIKDSVKDIEKRLEEMTLETLLSGEYDKNNAILTLHSGAGGTESQDWAQMLYRMYTRWAER